MKLLGTVLNLTSSHPLDTDFTEGIPIESITTWPYLQTTSNTGKAAFFYST